MTNDNSELPVRPLPPCHRHFFKGHKWWCRACDRETQRQVEDLLVEYIVAGNSGIDRDEVRRSIRLIREEPQDWFGGADK